MRALAVALSLLLTSGAAAAPCSPQTPIGDPCALDLGASAPWRGTLTAESAWIEAAKARQALEARLAEAQAQASQGSPTVWGLVLGGLLFVGGLTLGAMLMK